MHCDLDCSTLCTVKIYVFYWKQFLCEYLQGKIIYDSNRSKGFLFCCLSGFCFRSKALTFSYTSVKEMVIKQSDRKHRCFKHVYFIVVVHKFIVQFNF
jgi:hypothetical protein